MESAWNSFFGAYAPCVEYLYDSDGNTISTLLATDWGYILRVGMFFLFALFVFKAFMDFVKYCIKR